MLVAAMDASSNRTRAFILALLAATLTSCGSDSDNPVTPPVDDHPTNTRMLTIVGTPRVKVNFSGSMTQLPGLSGLGGTFSVALTDSLGRRVFLNDVRLAGVAMHEERDPTLNLPSRYVLDSSELPSTLAIGDTLLFEVRDGGDISPPFSYVILPSHLTLPADSTVIRQGEDIVLPFTGVVERVILSLVDSQGTRLRYNLQVENYSGQTSIFIRGSDLEGLSPGDLSLGTDMLDTEVIIEPGSFLQTISMVTKQSRALRLDP
jgi:hypothetical protein